MLSDKNLRGPVIMPHRVLTSRRRRNYTVKAVNDVDIFGGVACSIVSCVVVEIFAQKNSVITVLSSCTAA